MLIEETWTRLREKLILADVPEAAITRMGVMFAGALYAASAAIVMEHASSRDLSEAAGRIEAGLQ